MVCVVSPACNCASTGAERDDCDRSGQCMCKFNFAGLTCDRCAAGFYRYPDCQGESTRVKMYATAWTTDVALLSLLYFVNTYLLRLCNSVVDCVIFFKIDLPV